jgi:isopenicillin N synthase-like dioxygenase
VLGTGRERMSVPFFHEARADAEIRPLPIDDYLWSTITKFVEFQGMDRVREPLRSRPGP